MRIALPADLQHSRCGEGAGATDDAVVAAINVKNEARCRQRSAETRQQRVVASAGPKREARVHAEHLKRRTRVVVPVTNGAKIQVHAVRDRVRLEQVPQLGELLKRSMRPFAAESTGGGVEDLAPTAKRGKRQQQAPLSVGGIGRFQGGLD